MSVADYSQGIGLLLIIQVKVAYTVLFIYYAKIHAVYYTLNMIEYVTW